MNVDSRASSAFHATGRFVVSPRWALGWESGGIRRQIEVIVEYGFMYPPVTVHTNAWRDDHEALERRSTGGQPGRGYLLSLPIDKRIFRETMRYARRDAEAFVETDLIRVGGLSPLEPWLKPQ